MNITQFLLFLGMIAITQYILLKSLEFTMDFIMFKTCIGEIRIK